MNRWNSSACITIWSWKARTFSLRLWPCPISAALPDLTLYLSKFSSLKLEKVALLRFASLVSPAGPWDERTPGRVWASSSKQGMEDFLSAAVRHWSWAPPLSTGCFHVLFNLPYPKTFPRVDNLFTQAIRRTAAPTHKWSPDSSVHPRLWSKGRNWTHPSYPGPFTN